MRATHTTLLLALTLCGCTSPSAAPTPSAASTAPAPGAASTAPAPGAAGAPSPAAHTEKVSPLAGAAVVIDVRTPEEVAQGHIEGALLIPIAELEARMAEVDAAVAGDKHKKVVTYCKAGRRAGQAKLALEQHGYSNVVNGGGYDDLK